MYSKFGLQPLDVKGYTQQVRDTYAPRRSQLSTDYARRRANLGRQLGDRSATPGQSDIPIEGAYATAASNLQGAEAQDILGGYDKSRQQQLINAQMLESILGQKDQFRAGKQGRRLASLSGKESAIGQYLSNLSGSSPFEDVLAAGGTAAKIIGAF